MLPQVSATLASQGSYDAFAIKFNTTGQVQWIVHVGGTGADAGQSIAMITGTYPLLAGWYQGSATPYSYDASGAGRRCSCGIGWISKDAL
jgi:hypothetical protein